MVTHCSTNRSIRCLFTAERTGCEIFIVLWPNTFVSILIVVYASGRSWGGLLAIVVMFRWFGVVELSYCRENCRGGGYGKDGLLARAKVVTRHYNS